MSGLSDVGYAELLLLLREHNVMDTPVMQFLMNDDNDKADRCIRQMLERPSNYKHKSTFEELVNARLALEFPFIEFSRDPLSSCWVAHQRVENDTERKATPKEQLLAMKKSLRVFLSEFDETRSLLSDRRWSLSDGAVMALYGYDRKGHGFAHCEKSASTIRHIIPSFMTVDFRRNIARSVATYVKEKATNGIVPKVTAEDAKAIYQKNDMAQLRVLLDDNQYHRFTRGCFGPMAAYLERKYPLPKTSEELKLLRGRQRSEVITLPLEADVELPPVGTLEYVDQTFQCSIHRMFLPPDMHNRAKMHLNTVPFLRGVGGRENISLLRIIYRTIDHAGFFTSKQYYPGTLAEVFEAIMMDYFQDYLNVQNDFVRRQCAGKYSFGEWKINMIQIVVSLAKNGAYAEHDDSGCMLNRLEGSIEPNHPSLPEGKISQAEAQWLLPSRAVQQTATFVQSSLKCDNHRVRWKDPSSSNNAVVGELETADNTLHLQLTKSQLMKHDVIPLDIIKFHPRLEWRAVWSFRATFCPVAQPFEFKTALGNQLSASSGMPHASSLPGPEAYESEDAVTGVLKHILDAKMGAANDSDESVANKKSKPKKKTGRKGRKGRGKSGRGSTILGGRNLPNSGAKSGEASEDSDDNEVEQNEELVTENDTSAYRNLSSDGYRRMTETQFWNLGFENVGQSFSLEGPDWFNLSGCTAIKMLLGQGCVAAKQCLEYSKDGSSRRRIESVVMRNILYTPNLNSAEAESRGEFDGRFPSPGDIFKLSRISADAGNPHTKRCHRPIGTDDRCAFVIILTQPYKNIGEAISEVIYGILAQKAVLEGTASEAEKEYAKKRHNDLHIYGSGGSPTPKGTHCPILDKDTRDMSYASFPTGQDPENEINRKLINLVHMNAVVAVFVNLEKFFGRTETSRILKRLKFTRKFQSDAAMFVNYYSMDSCTYGQDWFTGDRRSDSQPIDYLNQKMILLPDTRDKPALKCSPDMESFVESGYGHYTMFHQVPNWRFCLRTAFNDQESRILQTANLKLLKIPIEQEGSVSVTFSSNFSSNKLLDPANSIRINRRILLSIWIQSGQWKEYSNCQAGEEGDSPEWENNADSGEQVTTWDFSAKREELVKMSPKQAIDACLFLCAAVAMRLLRKSLVKEDRGWVATALPVEMQMPNSLSLNATPSPIRTMDAIPLCLIGAAFDEGLLQRKRGPNDQRDRRAVLSKTRGASIMALSRYIFVSTAWRVTGRINAVAAFRAWAGRKDWMPGPENIHLFLDFIDAICDYSGDESMRHFRSAQHEQSIMSPLAVRKGLHHFLSRFSETVNDIGRKLSRFGDRRESLLHLAATFHRCTIGDDTDKNSVNCIWIAGEVLADVEEVFLDPFGPVKVDSIARGTGSKAGMKYIKPQKPQPSETDQMPDNQPPAKTKKRSRDKGKKTKHIPLKTKSSDARVQAMDRTLTKMEKDEFKDIAAEMLDDLNSRSNEELKVMFLFRRDDGVAAVILTGRPVNKKDMEMGTCKVSIIRAFVLPVRSVTLQPTCYSRHCHPVPTCTGELPWDCISGDILVIANDSASTFPIAREQHGVQYPEMVLYVGEKGDKGQRKKRSVSDKKKRQEWDKKREEARKEKRKKAAKGKSKSDTTGKKSDQDDDSSLSSGSSNSDGNKSQKSTKSVLPFARREDFPPKWMDSDYEDNKMPAAVEIRTLPVDEDDEDESTEDELDEEDNEGRPPKRITVAV